MPATELGEGARALGIELGREQIEKLLRYLDLLRKWNSVYNLTAIRDEEKLIAYHLLDSLSVATHIAGSRMADIGTGGGFPGIPLAIAIPRLHVLLLDSNHKKTAFLRQAVIELGLGNVEVAASRAESYQTTDKFDVVTSRAFADLATFTEVSRHLILPGAMLCALKGTYPNEELEQLPSDVKLEKIVRLNVPGLAAERHLVLLRFTPTETPR